MPCFECNKSDTVAHMTMLLLALFASLGLLLLIAGVRLIGLIAALTGGVLGWCLGGVVHDTVVPEWSPALCAATASVAFAAIAALFVRPAVAIGFGVAGTLIGLLFGGLLVERGIAPTAQIPLVPATGVLDNEATPAASVRSARSGLTAAIVTILGESRIASTPPRSETSTDSHATATTSATTDTLSRLAGLGSRTTALIKSRWALVPQATQTFLFATTACGAIMGFALGILFSRWALAGAAATLGSLLLLGCGMPLLEMIVPSFRCPESPAAWLFIGGATTLAGWAFQMRRVQSAKQSSSTNR